MTLAPPMIEAGLSATELWPLLCQGMQDMDGLWAGMAPPAAADIRLAALPLQLLAELAAPPGVGAALSGLLTEAEKRRFCGLKLPRRRQEWLGGRLAAKFALMQLAATKALVPEQIGIVNDCHGQPLAQAADQICRPMPRLSLSHSGGLAVAVAAYAACGLDVQERSPRLVRVQERFADAEEQALGAGTDALSWLTLLWAAKEAVKKRVYASQPTFMERIRVTALEGSLAAGAPVLLYCALSDRPESVVVRAALRAGHALALTVEDGEHA